MITDTATNWFAIILRCIQLRVLNNLLTNGQYFFTRLVAENSVQVHCSTSIKLRFFLTQAFDFIAILPRDIPQFIWFLTSSGIIQGILMEQMEAE
jgi:hypothetical protein